MCVLSASGGTSARRSPTSRDLILAAQERFGGARIDRRRVQPDRDRCDVVDVLLDPPSRRSRGSYPRPVVAEWPEAATASRATAACKVEIIMVCRRGPGTRRDRMPLEIAVSRATR